MPFTTELVARADKYQTVSQTISADSGSVTLPAGTWLCTLTGSVSIYDSTVNYIELDGVRANAGRPVDDGGSPYATANLGVVIASTAGGRNLAVSSEGRNGSMTFNAARIG